MGSFDKKYVQTSNPYESIEDKNPSKRNIFYGQVISIVDETDGGGIKVRIPALDKATTPDDNLPFCYPMLPKFFHVYPKVGEVVRIFIQDMKYPNRSRFWLGSVISQPHKVGFDPFPDALSTTNAKVTAPEKAPSTFPNADGVYPTKEDIAIVGRVNTDIIFRNSQLEFRAGKHENNEPLKLNTTNPATFSLTYEAKPEDEDDIYSSSLLLSDKIALISHDGIPKFKAAKIEPEDRVRIFNEAHPMARGDVLVQALNIIRRAIIAHIHGYSGVEADKNSIIKDLESLNFEEILQKNIVIN
jgi:hypothetical protein